MGHNRRKFDNMTDHDILIAHTVKIDTLCALMRANNKQLETFSKKLDTRCVRIHNGITATHREIFAKIDKKADSTTFRWAIGIMALVILSMAGLVGNDLLARGKGAISLPPIEYRINDTRGVLHGGL